MYIHYMPLNVLDLCVFLQTSSAAKARAGLPHVRVGNKVSHCPPMTVYNIVCCPVCMRVVYLCEDSIEIVGSSVIMPLCLQYM